MGPSPGVLLPAIHLIGLDPIVVNNDEARNSERGVGRDVGG